MTRRRIPAPAAVLWALACLASCALALSAVDADTGIEDHCGILALGDFNNDRYTDLVVLLGENCDVTAVKQYSSTKDLFVAPESLKIFPPHAHHIPVAAFASDFTYDGRLDILVTWNASASENASATYFSAVFPGASSGFGAMIASLWSDTLPFVFDADGDMRPDIAVVQPGKSEILVRLAANNFENATPFATSCVPSPTHAHAFLDISGDCAADLVIICTPSGGQTQLEVHFNEASGWRRAPLVTLLFEAAQISFGDIDMDGSVDIVAMSGDRIDVHFNVQKPFCAKRASDNCRSFTNMCAASDGGFNNDEANVVSASASLLFGNGFSLGGVPDSASVGSPLSSHIKVADVDLDGFPDILSLARGPNGGIHVAIIRTEPCDTRSCSAAAAERGRRVPSMANMLPTADFSPTDAFFFDYRDNGPLDAIVVARTDSGRRTAVVFESDASNDGYFFKALMTNGVCGQYCDTDAKPGLPPRVFGVNYVGGTIKLSIVDADRSKRAVQASQLSQTSHGALQLPFGYIGLGLTNNYLDDCFAGIGGNKSSRTADWHGLIPNSQIIIHPYYEPGIDSTSSWAMELNINPSEHTPFVFLSVALSSIVLGAIIIGLSIRERRQDQKERKRAIMMLNFDAL